MRKIVVFAVCCTLLTALSPAQETVRIAPAGNVLTRYLDRANIHPPVHVGWLTVFPITLSSGDEPAMPEVLTLQQALKKELLVVEELDNAQVAQARFVNKSRDRMIFLMAGEVITGGKQNRTLSTDALLAPDSAVVLPLYCVQKGRWQGGKDFGGPVTVAPMGVRMKAASRAGQQEVWSEVSRANERMGHDSPSGDLAGAMNKPENVERLRKLRRPIVDKLPAGCVGVVVAQGDRIVAADLFNSRRLFADMRDVVLNSYLSEYGHDRLSAPERDIARPSPNDVRDYLQGCYRASFTASDTRGVGRIYEIGGARTGQTLVYQTRGPINADKPDRTVRLYRRHMVHTALMEKVVPVRPGPIPVPPIRPPVPEPYPQPRPRR